MASKRAILSGGNEADDAQRVAELERRLASVSRSKNGFARLRALYRLAAMFTPPIHRKNMVSAIIALGRTDEGAGLAWQLLLRRRSKTKAMKTSEKRDAKWLGDSGKAIVANARYKRVQAHQTENNSSLESAIAAVANGDGSGNNAVSESVVKRDYNAVASGRHDAILNTFGDRMHSPVRTKGRPKSTGNRHKK